MYQKMFMLMNLMNRNVFALASNSTLSIYLLQTAIVKKSRLKITKIIVTKPFLLAKIM